MPEWLSVALGLLAGIVIVGGALAWARWPRRSGKRTRLPSPTDPGSQYEAPYVHPPFD